MQPNTLKTLKSAKGRHPKRVAALRRAQKLGGAARRRSIRAGQP